MKRLNALYRFLLSIVLAFLTATAEAQVSPLVRPASSESSASDNTLNNIKISLLTCSPGSEVWSLYGHTALRLQDPAHGLDVAINWGMFNYNQPYFILRFVFGLCDYQMGIEPMQAFIDEYRSEGRGVTEQELMVTDTEKQSIIRAIAHDYQPENRTYRYNFFYDNCTSRAGNMIVDHLNGNFIRTNGSNVETTWRAMIHQWTEKHRWARFGNDLLLGVMADRKASQTEREFLPDTLRGRFDKAMVVRDGIRQPIVESTKMLLTPTNETNDSDLWNTITPTLFWLAFLCLVVLIEIVEWRRQRSFIAVDIVLSLVSGVAGLLLFLMIFSKHPTVQVNLQILILNPLSLFFTWPAIRAYRRGNYHLWWRWIYPVCFLIFLVGSFAQDYTEGMYFIALALVSRCIRPAKKHAMLPFKKVS